MKVLLAGESWSTTTQNTLGFDSVYVSKYFEAKDPLKLALESQGIEVDYLPNHEAHFNFPHELNELQKYDAIILSDIGSNTLLLHPDMHYKCIRMPNRLELIKKYVSKGGGLLMCGGYMSFSGKNNEARYGITPLADALPVEMLNYDDRIDTPQGVFPKIEIQTHPILAGIDKEWPDFLGYNRIKAKDCATEIASVCGNDTFMACMDYGEGRSFAFASDCVPHWGTPEFVAWESYPRLWSNIVSWLAKKI